MDYYYAFSDEYGDYAQTRSCKFIQSSPLYVRATVMVKISAFTDLEEFVLKKKEEYRIPTNSEVKWAELGFRYAGKYGEGLEEVKTETITKYIEDVICFAASLKCKAAFTVFDNSVEYRARYDSMLKMHVQNALQKVDGQMKKTGGYAVLIIDDIGEDRNRAIKNASHKLLSLGDFTDYTHVKKSVLVDYSHHCPGLQLADYCAGIFGSELKRLKTKRNNYEFAHGVILRHMYKMFCHNSNYLPNNCIYPYGIREVPNNCGRGLCLQASEVIHQRFLGDIYENQPRDYVD